MRKLLGTFTIILISTVVAFSQGRDDHDDLGPVQVGYAVITPVSGTGMVAFATYGLRRTAETTQAGVLPSNLTTNAVLFVNSSGRLQKNLGVGIVNPGPTSVSVTLTLRNEAGVQVATTTITVGALQQIARFVTELFAGNTAVQSELMGTLTITSTAPVAAMGLRFRAVNFSTLPVTSLSATSPVPTIAPGIGGAGALLLPQFAAGGGWATQVVIGNTSASTLTVRVDLYTKDGTALTTGLNGQTNSVFTNIVIPA